MAEAKIKIEIDGVEYAVTQVNDLAKATENAADATDDLADAQAKNAKDTKDAAEETGFLTDQYEGLKSTFGKLKADFKLATKGISTFFNTGTKGAKLLKIAFASTGIGLLIVAIVSLIDYFKDTEEGSRVLTVAFESIGVIINMLIDWVANLGGMLIDAFTNPVETVKNLATTIQDFVVSKIEQLIEGLGLLGSAISAVFEGEFSKAADLAAEGFGKVGDSVLALNPVTAAAYQGVNLLADGFENVTNAVGEAVTATNNLVVAQRALRDLQQELIVQNAELTKELELNQKIAEDTTLSYTERAEALDRVNEANIRLAENAAKEAQANENAIRQELALADAYEEKEELQTRLAEAIAERISRETELQIKEQEAAKLSRELDQEELDRKQSINDAINSLRLENIEDEREAAREGLRIAEEAAVKELENLRASEEEIAALRSQFSEQRRQLEETFAEEDVARQKEINDKIRDLKLENLDDEKEVARQQLQIAEDAAVAELEAIDASEEQIAALRAEYAQQRADLEEGFINEKLEKEEAAAEFLRQQSLDAQQAEIDALRLKYEEQITLAGENSDLAAQLIEQREKAIAAVEDKYRDEKVDKDRAAQQAAVQNGLKLAAAGLQAIAALNEAAAGESEEEQRKAFNRNKALQIGIATIQTAQAVTAALTAGGNPLKLATGAQFVEAAIVAAQGLAQIIKIKRTKFSPAGGGGGGSDAGTGGTRPTFNAQASLSQLNESTAALQDPGQAIQPGELSTGEPAPVRAYVVATEMTDQQEANRNIDNLAKL